jgi:alkyl hydroperoxide reductase subunit AhpC
MLQKVIKTPKEVPMMVHPDCTESPLLLPKNSYLVILVFKAALEPLSSTELATFSASVANFASLDCHVMGVSRDSSHVIREWFQELGEAVQIPCVSDQHLGKEDYGLIQAMGVPLVDGYPLPSIIITDREEKVRYFATFRPDMTMSVEETLRVVAALREVDSAQGKVCIPADWRLGEATIPNTKEGVRRYYRERSEEGTGLFAALSDRLDQIYKTLFGERSPIGREEEKKVKEVLDNIVEKAVMDRKGIGEGEEKTGLLAGLRLRLDQFYKMLFEEERPVGKKEKSKEERKVVNHIVEEQRKAVNNILEKAVRDRERIGEGEEKTGLLAALWFRLDQFYKERPIQRKERKQERKVVNNIMEEMRNNILEEVIRDRKRMEGTGGDITYTKK